MKGSLVPCGHTFSDFQIYDEKTAKEEASKQKPSLQSTVFNSTGCVGY